MLVEGVAALHLAVPIVATGGLLGTSALWGMAVDPALIVALGSGAWAAYLAERLVAPPEDSINDRRRSDWMTRYRRVVWMLGVALAVVAMGAALWVSVGVLLGGVGIGAIGLAYALPGRWRIKRFGRAKPFLIGFVWSAAVVGLPMIEWEQIPDGTAALMLGRMLFYAANAMALDWPDRAGDAAAGVPTWAVRLSASTLRRFILMLAGGAAIASGAAGWIAGQPTLGVVDAGGALVLIVLIARRLPVHRYDSVVLDVLVAWPGVTWIAWHWLA